jgi:hypothetical protein
VRFGSLACLVLLLEACHGRSVERGGAQPITGIDDAFLIPQRDLVVVFPATNLGGDSCVGRLAIETAILVEVPASVR